MIGTDYTRERIHENARKQLADCDEATVNQLWGKMIAAFEQWKQEHGNRKPTANMGMLSHLLGPKPVPFKTAAPWQCADLLMPSPLALACKLIADSYPPYLDVINEAGFEKVLAVLILVSDEASTDDLQPFHEYLIKNETAKSVTKRLQMIEAIKERQRLKPLDEGRKKGSESQKEYAAETWRIVEQRHKQFLKRSDYAGWKPGQRATFLAGLMNAESDKSEPLKGRTQPNGRPYLASTIQKRLAKMG